MVSVGAAARINLFGFAVAEIDYVRPLHRPGPRLALAVQSATGILRGPARYRSPVRAGSLRSPVEAGSLALAGKGRLTGVRR